jgi:DNA-binding SARP family transcriptional activator
VQRLGIHLFGQPSFAFDRQPFPFKAPPRTLPLLAFLALHRDTHLARDTVAFALWPDESEETARANLRRHLNHLKSALPAGDVPWLRAEGDTLCWDGSAAWVDVHAFEDGVEHEATLAAAVDLYRGPLLDPLYDEWIAAARERLRARYLAALERLLLRSRRERDLRAASAYAHRVLREDPWREDTVRALIAVRYESGDRSGALGELERFAGALRAELGVDPMPETLALGDLIERDRPLPLDAGAISSPASRAGDDARGVPLVGRERELATLQRIWHAAARGRGTAVLLGGEAGIGKTRLVAELALLAEADGAAVVRGTTSTSESVAYQPFCEALRDAIRPLAVLDIAPLWLAALTPLLPELSAHRADLPALPALSAEREQMRILEALARVAGGLARRRPLLLVLEDLHWAGPATIAALEHLARRSAGHALMILATYRSEDVAAGGALSAARRRLSAENLLTHVALNALSFPDVAQLVRALLPGAADDLGERVFATSEGNPLFAIELVRDRIESAEEIVSTRGSLHETIAARVDRLTPGARQYAQIASLVGASFDVELVRAIADGTEGAASDALGELVDRRFVRDVGHSRFAYAFTHSVVQSAVYDGIDAAPRARWHHRAAVTLERLSEGGLRDERTLARHYDAAGDAPRAAACYLASARRSYAVYALDEAQHDAERAAALGEDTRSRFETLLLLEAIAQIRDKPEVRRALLSELAGLATALDDPDAECTVLARTIVFATHISDRALERLSIDALFERARATGAKRWMASALGHRVRFDYKEGDWARAQRTWRDAEPYRDEADSSSMMPIAVVGAIAAVYRGDAAGAYELLAQGRAIVERSGDPLLRLRYLLIGENVVQLLGDIPAFDAMNREAMELAQALGAIDQSGLAEQGAGFVAWLRWDVAGAREHLDRAAQIAESIGRPEGVARVLIDRAGLEIDVGRLELGADLARRALAIVQPLGTLDAIADAELHLMRIALLRGESGIAETAMAALDRSDDGFHRPLWMLLAGAAELERGAHTAAAERFEAALEAFRAMRVAQRVPETQWQLACVHLAAQRLDDAEGCIEACFADLDRLGATCAPALRPQMLATRAAIAAARGDAANAEHLRARARTALAQLSERIPDDPSRAAFLALPHHRAIAGADDESTDPTVAAVRRNRTGRRR